jgi:hypothetical protein
MQLNPKIHFKQNTNHSTFYAFHIYIYNVASSSCWRIQRIDCECGITAIAVLLFKLTYHSRHAVSRQSVTIKLQVHAETII